MKGIILAAGFGGRLRPLTLNVPKVLLEVGGQPLINYPLEAMREAGIKEIGVVVGYHADDVSDYLTANFPEVSIINNDYYSGGNAISVRAAREFVAEEPFMLCMGDHPISTEFINQKLPYLGSNCTLYVDPSAWHSSQLDDATRVMVGEDGYIETIGKELRHWNATDTGVFKMTEDAFDAIENLMDTKQFDVTLTDVVSFMAQSGRPFSTCDVEGMFWADVDTLDDYRAVDSLLGGQDGERL